MIQDQLTKKSYTICLGCSSDEVYKLELVLNDKIMYFTGEVFNRVVFTSETGESRAREYLTDDKELWKQAVEHDNTEDSLEDWAEDVLRMDGWESVLGSDNIVEVDIDGSWYYYENTGSGDIEDSLDNLEETDLTEIEIDILKEAWEKIDSKEFKDIYQNKEHTNLLNRVIEIFQKYEDNSMLRFFEVES